MAPTHAVCGYQSAPTLTPLPGSGLPLVRLSNILLQGQCLLARVLLVTLKKQTQGAEGAEVNEKAGEETEKEQKRQRKKKKKKKKKKKRKKLMTMTTRATMSIRMNPIAIPMM